jgi:hypothetical protein
VPLCVSLLVGGGCCLSLSPRGLPLHILFFFQIQKSSKLLIDSRFQIVILSVGFLWLKNLCLCLCWVSVSAAILSLGMSKFQMYEHEICKPWTADWKVCVCNIKQDIFWIWKCWKYRGYFVEISVNIIFEIKVILEIFYLSFDKFGHKACRTSVLVRAPVTMEIRVVTSMYLDPS